jgi:hypothetical protein
LSFEREVSTFLLWGFGLTVGFGGCCWLGGRVVGMSMVDDAPERSGSELRHDAVATSTARYGRVFWALTVAKANY